jgi:hypothetical protein
VVSESKAHPSAALFSTVHDLIWPSSSATQTFILQGLRILKGQLKRENGREGNRADKSDQWDGYVRAKFYFRLLI